MGPVASVIAVIGLLTMTIAQLAGMIIAVVGMIISGFFTRR